MPAASQVLNFFKQTLAGGVLEALTPGSGDSNTFQNFTMGSEAFLAEVRAIDTAHSMLVSLIASRFHDQVLGIAGYVPSGATLAPVNRPVSISPAGVDQPIYPSDVMTVQVLGTANDHAQVSVVVYYADLPGIAANLRTWQAVKPHVVNMVGVQVTVDPSSLAQGDWSTPVSISAAGRRLDAGKYYALMGFTGATPLGAVGVQAFETGNLRVGGPLLGDADHDSAIFKNLSELYGTALIPVIAGNNQDNVKVQAADPVKAATAMTVMFAELDGPI